MQNSSAYDEQLTRGGIKLKDPPFFSQREKRWLGDKQPVRTDFEALISDNNFVEVEIEP